MSDSDPGMLALLAGIVSDEAMKKRIVTLQAELEKVHQERLALEAATVAHQETLSQIQQKGRENEAKAAELAASEQKHEDDKAGLTQVVDNHTAERDRWEAVRQQVDADHAAREAALKAAEDRIAAIEEAHAQRDRDLLHREASVTERERAHLRRYLAIEAALKVA